MCCHIIFIYYIATLNIIFNVYIYFTAYFMTRHRFSGSNPGRTSTWTDFDPNRGSAEVRFAGQEISEKSNPVQVQVGQKCLWPKPTWTAATLGVCRHCVYCLCPLSTLWHSTHDHSLIAVHQYYRSMVESDIIISLSSTDMVLRDCSLSQCGCIVHENTSARLWWCKPSQHPTKWTCERAL